MVPRINMPLKPIFCRLHQHSLTLSRRNKSQRSVRFFGLDSNALNEQKRIKTHIYRSQVRSATKRDIILEFFLQIWIPVCKCYFFFSTSLYHIFVFSTCSNTFFQIFNPSFGSEKQWLTFPCICFPCSITNIMNTSALLERHPMFLVEFFIYA